MIGRLRATPLDADEGAVLSLIAQGHANASIAA
jgi:DNA-binding NarL/FixJ family response regulator